MFWECWNGYIRCSQVQKQQVSAALRRSESASQRVVQFSRGTSADTSRQDYSETLVNRTALPVLADSRAASRICMTVTLVSSALRSPWSLILPLSAATRYPRDDRSFSGSEGAVAVRSWDSCANRVRRPSEATVIT